MHSFWFETLSSTDTKIENPRKTTGEYKNPTETLWTTLKIKVINCWKWVEKDKPYPTNHRCSGSTLTMKNISEKE